MGITRISGVTAPCLTPFDRSERVDEQALEGVIEFLAGKVHWIAVGGIYGSGIMMEREERKRVLDVALRANRGRSRILFFVGAVSTDTSVDLARHAEAAGAWAVSCVEPIYYRQVEDAIYWHYEQIVRAVELPVYVYDSPVFSGNGVSVDNLRRLAEAGLAGTITGHAGLGIEHLWRVMRGVGDTDLDIISIRDGLALPALMTGAVGFESGVANYLPELVIDLHEAITGGDYDRAVELQDRILRVRDVSHMFGRNIPSLHALVELRGVSTGVPKSPFYRLTDSEAARLKEALEEIDGVSSILGAGP